MGLNKTADGRYIVGQGVENGNENHGFNGKRDIVIQLTADGATADGLNALEYLKAYAMNAKTENKPIFPDGARVWISTNGYSKAVEADDVVIDGSNITIGGIVWNGSAWDFSNAGQTGGGGTGGGVLVVREVQHQGETLVSGTLPNVAGYRYTESHGEGRIDLTVAGIGDTIPLSSVVVTIGTETYSGNNDLGVQDTDTLRVKLKGEQLYPESAITGLTITVVESYTELDHTWQEISDAGFAVFNDNGNICTLSSIFGGTGYYGAVFYACYNGEQGVEIYNVEFSTSSASGYPARNE